MNAFRGSDGELDIRSRKLVIGGVLVAATAALGVGQAALQAATQGHPCGPTFEVDPFWLVPCLTSGCWAPPSVSTSMRGPCLHHSPPGDAQRAHRGRRCGQASNRECCVPAPPVLEFDPEGNLVNSWGGPGAGYTWPVSNHGIAIDHKDNIWIGGNGERTRTSSSSRERASSWRSSAFRGARPTARAWTLRTGCEISFDPVPRRRTWPTATATARRGLDMNTGAIKRFWGAYGNNADACRRRPLRSRRPWRSSSGTPSLRRAVERRARVCLRPPNDRIQVFRTNGTFVKEVRIAPRTLGDGSVWDIAFSRDPQQKYIYLADGKNEKVYIIDRASLEILTSFGGGGRQPGQFFAVHSIATDSKESVHDRNVQGKRLQKFVYRD